MIKMRIATKIIIAFVLIVVTILLWRILTPKQKPRLTLTPNITETTKTPIQPAQIPQQPITAVPKHIPVTKTEVATETTKTPTQPTQIPQQKTIEVPEQISVTKTEAATETTKTPNQPAQTPQHPTIEIPEQKPVTKTEVTTATTNAPFQPTQLSPYLSRTTITKESTYLWLARPYEIKQKIDYVTNQIYYEIWKDSIFLGVEKVMPLRDYFVSSLYDSILRRHRGEVQQTQSQGEQAFDRMGLIPDVELPKIPLFGEGSRINVSGSDKITFGGRTTFTSGFTQTAIKPSLLPELKMDQALKVNLDGTIGERTKVLIDHDSEREQAGQNKISLTYTGTEDDILQDLEFGDTRLVIPSTAYTGDLPSRKGLFGVSGKAKLGGIDLYAIASREQSQGETKEFLGQTVVSSDTIWDTDFLRRTFFWIGETSRIADLKVYINDGVITNPNAEPAIATVLYNLPESIPTYGYDRDSGRYALKVQGQDYLVQAGNLIEFIKNAPLPNNWSIGITYVVGAETIGGRRILPNNDTILVLKMIKPRYTDTLSLCWNYELKNIYSLDSKDVKIDTIKILRKVINADPSNYPQIEDNGPKSGQTFLRILGLDPDNNGVVEWPEFDASRGYIIFPKEFPFADESLSVRDSIIYRKDALSAGEGKKYLIAISYSTAKGSFNLGQFDILDGSEKVYVNGQQQTKDDYEINYVTGEIKFKKPLPPNASVKVTYEYQPLFSLAQKSLVGTRGEWKFGDNGRIGTSLFYRQEAMPETRATLGAEPFQRLIAETDLSYNYKSDFITSILQKVPLLHSQSTSNFAFASEGAISLPNPNTRGIAYLDDFEKTTLSQDVFTRGLVWQFSSVPIGKDTNTFAQQRLFWYNPTSRIRKDSIFGSGLGEEGKETVDYLKVIYIPTDSSSWAGMMTCASQSGLNLTEIENLEVVLRTTQQFPQNGKIHFTVATRIDEDAPRRTKNGQIAGYNNLQDKEDRNNNGILDEGLGEDTGLDTIMGTDADNIIGDDGNDDYDATNNPIGTEGNKRLDDEDLAGDGFSRDNDYYEYTISLNDSTFFTPLANNWKLLRIPLMDSTVMHNSQVFFSEGIPKWEDIRIVRIWLSGFSTPDTFDFYTISFVGSRWRNAKVIRPDTTTTPPVDSSENVSVASISQKTDPTYNSPFELHRDQNGVTEYEASLALSYDSIQSGHIAITTKSNFDNEDYRDYGTIKIYIHNDINDPNFIFRFGGDSLNYYEFGSKISDGNPVAGYDGWYEFEISLDTVVLVKSQKQGHDTIIGRYRVYGSPSLSAIGYQALGIINQKPDLISGSVWFDDMRLFNPRAEVGYGFQSNASFNLSDLASASLSFGYSDPNFRRFSEGRGVKTGGFETNLGYTIRASLDKFFPTSWGLSIPISYSRNTSNSLPKYSTQYADLRLSHNDTVAEDEKSTSGQEQWALNNLSKAKSGNQILNYTLEALSYSMGQRKTNSKSLLNLDTSYARYATLDYRVEPDLKISILDNDIYLFPNSISAGLDITDSRSVPRTRSTVRDSWIPRYDTTRAADVSLDVEYTPLEDFNLNYSYGSTRDLFPPDASVGIAKKAGVNMGVETDDEETFGADYEFSLFDIIRPRLSYDGHYTETHPKLSGIYSESRNFDNNSTMDVSTELDLPEVLQKIGDIGGSGASKVFNGLSSIFQSIDLSYNNERNATFTSVSQRPSFLYRLGFIDKFTYDTIRYRTPQITRATGEDFSASSGIKIKDISASVRYGRTIDNNIYTYDINGDRSIVWPEVSLSLGRIEKLLFGLATSSDISTSYRLEQRNSGTILGDTFRTEGKQKNMSKSFAPLLSWQTTWKSRLSTNVSANYSQSSNDLSLTSGTASSITTQSGANASLTYTFSATKGIPLPFLKRVRLSSDLSFTWNLRYDKTLAVNRDYLGNESQSRNDRNIGTNVATSYRLSNSIESGITAGYTAYSDIQRGRTTKNVDLNFWVLFKF